MSLSIRPSFSTIMVSYLEWYPGSRKNPVEKFNRAVESWYRQSWKEKELIIVSDGCELTYQEWYRNWSHIPNIRLIRESKSPDNWPGEHRERGIIESTGEWILYLDSDDIYLPDYLERLAESIEREPHRDAWINMSLTQAVEELPTPNMAVYVIAKSAIIPQERMGSVNFSEGTVNWVSRDSQSTRYGTSCLLHKRWIRGWKGSPERGEDLQFSDSWSERAGRLHQPGYVICHLNGWIDL